MNNAVLKSLQKLNHVFATSKSRSNIISEGTLCILAKSPIPESQQLVDTDFAGACFLEQPPKEVNTIVADLVFTDLQEIPGNVNKHGSNSGLRTSLTCPPPLENMKTKIFDFSESEH